MSDITYDLARIFADNPLDPRLIHPSTLDALERYVEHGIPPGDFLQAVLSNDLVDAVQRADANNQRALLALVQYVYNEVPSDCYGNREVIEARIRYFAIKAAAQVPGHDFTADDVAKAFMKFQQAVVNRRRAPIQEFA